MLSLVCLGSGTGWSDIRNGNNVLKGKQLCENKCGVIGDSKLLSYPEKYEFSLNFKKSGIY